MSGPPLLLGNDGSTFANLVGATQLNAAGNAIYFKNGYSSPTGGIMLFFHVNWRPSGDSANFLKGCVYQNGNLVAVSSPIAKPAVAGDVFAPITGTINPNLPYILVAVPDQGYWTAGVDQGSNNFNDRQNTAANFNYTNPPAQLPAVDVTVGQEVAMWVEGGPIALVNTVFTAALQAPIRLAPVSATLAIASDAASITAKTSPVPATATITYGGLSVTLSLGVRPTAGAISMGTAAPSLVISAAGVKQPTTGSMTFAGGAPSLFVNNPGVISHGQPTTFVLPGGTGAGTKTVPGPQVFDDCSDAPPGSISIQWTSPTRLPSAAGGIYNYQNQPPGFDPSGSGIGVPNMHVSGISAGAHLVQGSNDSNTVGTGFKYTVPTSGGVANYPWCDTREYYYRYDPAWNSDPTSDNNVKLDEDGVGTQVFDPSNQFQYLDPFPVNQFGIIGISLTNPLVVTFGAKQAVNPFGPGVGNIIEFYDVLGTTQINGLATPIVSAGGVNGAWTVTCNVDATGWSPLATPMTVTNITNANPGVMTVSSVNPPAVNQQFTVQGVAGMTQINGQTMKAGTATGSPGNWTFPLQAVGFIGANFDTRTTSGFGTYTGGGTITCGGGSIPYNSQMVDRGGAVNPSAGQMQYPTDANGNSSTTFLSHIKMPFCPANGWIKRRIERCLTNIVGSPGNTGPGYYQVFDNNVLIYDYVGRTDWISPSSLVRHMSYGSAYARDRGPTNFCFVSSGYYDVSDQGVTGQVPRAYLGDQPILANCTVLEPQVADIWTDGSVHIPKLNAGKFLPGAVVYKLICPASAKGTALNCGTLTIGPTAQPVVNNTTFLPALVGKPYSASVSVTGGVPPYKYYIPNPEANGWVIDVNTGILSATAPSVLGNDGVVIGVVDSAGTNGFGSITIPVVNYDFLIGPNGLDTNPGTAAQPWSLNALNTKRATYAGKRIGVLPGTYSCLTILGQASYTGDFATPAFNIAGGTATAQTIIQSTVQGGAILDGQTSSTATNPNGQPLIGTIGNASHNGTGVAGLGYITLDGFKIINCFNRAVSCGADTGASYTGTRLLGMVVQNCDISAISNTLTGANPTGITMYSCDGALIQNNKIYGMSDTTTRSSGIELWTSWNCITQYNTVIGTNANSGGILHKNSSQKNNTIRYNYIDLSVSSAAGNGCYGMTCDADGGAGTFATMNNNVVIADNPIAPDAIDVGGYPNTLHTKNIFNNTFVGTPGFSVGGAIFFGAAGTVNYYNNIVKRTGTVGGRGDWNTNQSAPAKQDYNCYPVSPIIGLTANGATGYPTGTTYNLATIGAALPAGCVGKEAHSKGVDPMFTGVVDSTGFLATAYQLNAGSPCKNAGTSDGTVSGTPTDMGAFGNGATQIGANISVFDFYIATSGNDANSGSQAYPWALSSLCNPDIPANVNATITANRAKMAGKRVGILPGTYTGTSYVPGGQYNNTASGQGFSTPIFAIPPGSSGASTVLQATTPLGAIIDASGTDTNNPGGNPLMGSRCNAADQYIEINGLEVRNHNSQLICIGGNSGNGVTPTANGIVVRNNYLHNVANTSTSGGNTAALTFFACIGPVCQNNYITKVRNVQNRNTGMEFWSSTSHIIEYNTVFMDQTAGGGNNPGGCIFIKGAQQHQATIRYNYCDNSAAGASGNAAICWDISGTASNVSKCHHNIGVCAQTFFLVGAGGVTNTSQVEQTQLYNNTCLYGNSGCAFEVFGSGAMLTVYNNVMQRSGAVSGRGDLDCNAANPALSDYQLWTSFQYGLSANGTTNYPTSLLTTQAAIAAGVPAACIGKEAHSVVGLPTFVAGTPTLPGPYYQLSGGSLGKGTGSATGQTGGAAIDMGAWGGTDDNTGLPISQIGCNHAHTPYA